MTIAAAFLSLPDKYDKRELPSCCQADVASRISSSRSPPQTLRCALGDTMKYYALPGGYSIVQRAGIPFGQARFWGLHGPGGRPILPMLIVRFARSQRTLNS